MGMKPRKPAKPAFAKPRKPAGFTLAGQEEARHLMRSTLQQLQLSLRAEIGVDSRLYLHTNRDGSIDAELKIKGRRMIYSGDVFTVVSEFFPRELPEIWISSGIRFSATRDEDNYHRFKGLQQVQSYYSRAWSKDEDSPNKAQFAIFAGDRIGSKVEKRQRKKADSYFLRLHWNQTGKKPGREDKRRDR